MTELPVLSLARLIGKQVALPSSGRAVRIVGLSNFRISQL